MALLWLAFSIAGLLFLIAGLVWLGWFADPARVPPLGLPQTLVPLLAIPVAIAVGGYGFAIRQLWLRQAAMSSWLVGFGAHLVYIVLDTLSAGFSPADAVTWESFGVWTRLLLPGALILMIDRDRIERAFQP